VAELDQEIAQAELLRRVLVNGPFPGMGTGDPDTYKGACWRFWSLVRNDDGHVAVVLPRSALAAKGSRDFRLELLKSCQFNDLTWLLNRMQWVFGDVHPQTTIVLSSWCKRAPTAGQEVPLRGPYTSLQRFVSGVAE